VCDIHGGKIPAVRQSARERLLAMVDPALDALLRALQTGPPCEHCGRSDADRDPVVLRAAQLVLDRAGFHPTIAVAAQSSGPDLSHLTLSELADRAERIAHMARESANAEAARLLPEATEGFIVPEDGELGQTVDADSTQVLEQEHVTAPLPVCDPRVQNGGQRVHDGNDTPGESK